MKVERSTPISTRAITTAVADTLPQSNDALIAEFTAALRQHRRKESSQRDDSRSRSNAQPTARPQQRSARMERERDVRILLEPALADLTEQISQDARSLQQLLRSTEPASHAQLSTGQTRDMKRRRAKDHTDATAPCIEIVHAGTGTRCTLSREAGVWILSFESQPLDAVHRDTVSETIRKQFAAKGLGPVDIIF
jgi:hypothetical protein